MGIVLVASFLFLVWPIYTINPVTPRSIANLSNFKQVNLAAMMYAADNEEHLPITFTTNQDLIESLGSYTKNDKVFLSLNVVHAEMLGNRFLSGADLNSVTAPDETVTLFESNDWPEKNWRCLAFVDGHVKYRKGFRAEMLTVEFVEVVKE